MPDVCTSVAVSTVRIAFVPAVSKRHGFACEIYDCLKQANLNMEMVLTDFDRAQADQEEIIPR